MPIQLFFSDNIESLAGEAAHRIARFDDLFNPPVIIVPNPYLKKWLQLKIASSNGIVMNLNFKYLEDGLWDIFNRINPHSDKPSPIAAIDLQLILYYALRTVGKDENRITSIIKYLYNIDGTKINDYEKKLFQLSGRLAQYFLEYEHTREEMIQCWMNGKLLYDSEIESGQQFLYELIFKKNGYRDTINESLLTVPQYWHTLQLSASNKYKSTVIFFALSHLYPLHAKIIYSLGKYLDIDVYQVNPCSEFWEDVTSPQEDRWQRVRSISINQNTEGALLAENPDDNPLLKLWGQTGRETIKIFSLLDEAGSQELNFTSTWIATKRPDGPRPVLGTIQDQILNRSAALTSGKKLKQDKTIQVASCPSIFREVETVYNNILLNLDTRDDLNMSDIAIMVPDMNTYGPVIHSVFLRNPALVSYSTIDSNAAIESIFGAAVRSIINIATGTFTRNEIFNLFHNQYFLDAHDLSFEDISIWLNWVDDLNIFHDFFKNDGMDPLNNLYTWQQGLQRLRLSRIMQSIEGNHEELFLNYKQIIPHSDMYTNDEDRINAFTTLTELLFARVKDLKLANLGSEGWIQIIEKLISDFLMIPDDKPEEFQVYNELISSLNKLKLMDCVSKNKNHIQLSLAFIKEYIEDNLIRIPSSIGGYLTRGINISALVPKRQIPFKIIYIMGMQEGIFPGNSDRSTLNLTTIKRQIGDTTRPDANRYLFLETLLGTRNKLYITYVSKDLQKDQDYYPNSVVGQLINFMNNYVLAEHFKTVPVPISGSSDKYLSMVETTDYSDFLISVSYNNYQPVIYNESDRLMMYHAASRNNFYDKDIISVISAKIQNKISQVPFEKLKRENENTEIEIAINDLRLFLINPIESTLRWHLSLYDENETDLTSREDEPFYSVYPFSYQLTTTAINYYIRSDSKTDVRKYIAKLYRHSQLSSITPAGAFSDIDIEKLTEEAVRRIDGNNGIADFINSRKNLSFFQNIIIGQSFVNSKPGIAFPAIHTLYSRNSQDRLVMLNGNIPFLWKNDTTGECETLVVTNSSTPKAVNIINAFLFFIISTAGLDLRLQAYAGNGKFTIHVSCSTGMSSYVFNINETESKKYLEKMIIDFLDENSKDMLPLSIITDKRLLSPADMEINPEDSEKQKYCHDLQRLINDDAEKMFPSYRSTGILELFNPEVPRDAYDKVRSRFSLLLQPFQR